MKPSKQETLTRKGAAAMARATAGRSRTIPAGTRYDRNQQKIDCREVADQAQKDRDSR